MAGCSNKDDVQDASLNETTNEMDQESVSNEELLTRIDELYQLNEELEKKLNQQKKVMKLLPQAWDFADRFLTAYVELDFEVLHALTSDAYTIEEQGILFTELETHVPYLAEHNHDLSYVLNDFELMDVNNGKVFMNIAFFLDGDDELDSGDLVFMNLVLERNGNMWIVTDVELS
ncbi:hypothetical protein J2T56_001469 [Natronobacillus azotifigens]|uniref:Uncharacterized protein n=1 Tax=Natronobacillus azotifigens TaxID=472978 RepID=A0A9J6RCG6_9BACI|nr:hypothetical protein [Natronobacillus azotifigens]MCZ0703205.1 hypothetical protein [Natronobacillus azotifigens]